MRVLSWSSHIINVFWSLKKRSVQRKVKFGGKFFQPKLLSRLSHKVCRLLSSPVLLRKFTNNDEDGSENITKKMNLSPFKLYRVYLEPLYSSDVGDFSWSRILKGFIHVQIEKGKFVVVCPRPPHSVALAGFTS